MSLYILIPIFSLLLVVILGYSVLGIFLIIRAYKTRHKNLYLIGFGFILVTIGIVGNLLFAFGRYFQVIFLGVGYLSLAIFIYQTFHKKKRKSSAKSILSLIIVLFVIRLFVGLIKAFDLNVITYYIDLIVVNAYVSIIFFWLGWSASKDYSKLRKIEIEPWIKTRYGLIAISAYIFLFQGLSTFIIPWNVKFGDPSNILSFIQFTVAVILGAIFSIGMVFAWIMPKRFKKYLHLKKGYEISDGIDIPEEELIDLIKKQLMEDA